MKLNPPASSSDLETARQIARRLHQSRRRDDGHGRQLVRGGSSGATQARAAAAAFARPARPSSPAPRSRPSRCGKRVSRLPHGPSPRPRATRAPSARTSPAGRVGRDRFRRSVLRRPRGAARRPRRRRRAHVRVRGGRFRCRRATSTWCGRVSAIARGDGRTARSRRVPPRSAHRAQRLTLRRGAARRRAGRRRTGAALVGGRRRELQGPRPGQRGDAG